MVEEEAEYQQDDYDVIAQNSPPGCYFGGDIGHKAEKTSMRQNTISINSGGTTKITPISTKGPPPTQESPYDYTRKRKQSWKLTFCLFLPGMWGNAMPV
jgi:hypothetical protein